MKIASDWVQRIVDISDEHTLSELIFRLIQFSNKVNWLQEDAFDLLDVRVPIYSMKERSEQTNYHVDIVWAINSLEKGDNCIITSLISLKDSWSILIILRMISDGKFEILISFCIENDIE